MTVVPVMAQSVWPFPPGPGCAGWYIMKWLKEHGWHPGMPPPILPMICWASIPPSTPGRLIPLPPYPLPHPPHPIPLG